MKNRSIRHTKCANRLIKPMMLAFEYILVIVVIIALSSVCAYAYIDPGTGSYFFQILIASLLGAGYAIKIYWQKLKAFFMKIFMKNKKDSTDTE